MAGPKITLYVDLVSPFSYMAYYLIKNSPVFTACQKSYVPVLLGGIIKGTGNIPPINIKNKDKWIARERLRWAGLFNIPMTQSMPKPFPVSTIHVQRALCAISALQPEKLIPCIDALSALIWVEGKSAFLQTPDGFVPVLEGVLGKDLTAKVLEKSATPEIKAQLSSNTERALESGAFGLPWLECTNAKGETECFWGVDHLAQAALFLGLDREMEKGFRALM